MKRNAIYIQEKLLNPPKLFISYSWSNPDHEQWVLELATQLRESGVDVIFDKWDLKEGHDSIAFMEKMVTDQEIKKVALVSDEVYARKADGRDGAVGTETQIISKEVYEKQSQDKFVAIVAQKDKNGKPCLPTYYKSRIYIDLSEPDKYIENFEKLLRWIFEKPLYVKPEIGKKPSFLDNTDAISLGTATYFSKVIDAIKNNKSFSYGALEEYLSIFSKNLEKFRIIKSNEEFDELVIINIDNFIPQRNEAVQLFSTIVQYDLSEKNIKLLHRFFESLIPYMNRPENTTNWMKWDFDNFQFIIHELFLYLIAIFLKNECFEQANYFLEQQYYLPGDSDYGRDKLINFLVFRKYLESFEYRNKRLKLGRASLRADLLKKRNSGLKIEFRHLLQADFVLFMRSEIEDKTDWHSWWPETLIYIGSFHSPFEIFARAVSKKYFDRMKCLLNINSPDDIQELLHRYRDNKRQLPRWNFETLNPKVLLGFDQLCKKP